MALVAGNLASVALLLAAAFLLFAAPQVAARSGPCGGGALLISYSSFSSSSDVSFNGESQVYRRPETFVAVFRVIGLRHRRNHLHSFPALPIHRIRPELETNGIAASLQERTKDIMVIVAGLLFGVGCGVLTAASVYLVYSIIANRDVLFGSDEAYYVDDEEDDIEKIKKAGYIKIVDAEMAKEEPAVADAKN